MKILIVDDNSDDRAVLRYLIKRNGHQPIEAENGEQGLEQIQKDPPNLIISDALMPTMDGFQFLRAVRLERGMNSIPFIFYSASFQQQQDVRLATALGADAYIMKPQNPIELWKKINEILVSKRKNETRPPKLVKEDAKYLKRYSEVLALKLEDKIQELNKSLEERERAENALEESEAKYRGFVEQSAEGIILLDESGTILECNPAFECLIGADTTEIVGAKIWDFGFELLPEGFTSECDFASLWGKWESAIASCEGITKAGPYEAVLKLDDDRRRKVIEQSFFPISTTGGLMIGGILRDVTERSEAAETLMASLREKELLLREVHHRVKNNLQVICSLVNLQLSNSVESSETIQFLRDMDARIETMSLVHELLYQSGDFASIEFSAYAAQLCDYLNASYIAEPGRVCIVTAIEALSLPIDKAIPCGLIINELIVNSLKHAFPNGRSGTVRVALQRDADGRASLTICDDGIGMANRDVEKIKRKSIGLTLVENLTAQLDGECFIEYGEGLRTRVVFPL